MSARPQGGRASDRFQSVRQEHASFVTILALEDVQGEGRGLATMIVLGQ